MTFEGENKIYNKYKSFFEANFKKCFFFNFKNSYQSQLFWRKN